MLGCARSGKENTATLIGLGVRPSPGAAIGEPQNASARTAAGRNWLHLLAASKHDCRVQRVLARHFSRLSLALILTGGPSLATAGVLINEFMAAASEQRLSWDADGVPSLGSGIPWMDPDFNPVNWGNAYLPAGYGFSGLSTVLTTQMKDKACSLFLRKHFVVDAEASGAENPLILSVQFNDGFVAYLNGREVARANAGHTNQFLHASQPAYNVNTLNTVIDFNLGPARNWLLSGTNLIAIQAHNADKPSTESWPEQISAHTPTAEFRIAAGLRLAGQTNGLPDVEFLPFGPSAGSWRFFVGRFEPSGGVVDPGLIARVFLPPAGEEDDYEQPEAFSDWVELHNDSSEFADLSGWALSDDCQVPQKWRFPTNTTIPPGGYLVVHCDDRDEANAPNGAATALHTNFKLADAGECLTLTDATGRWVDRLDTGYPPQNSAWSYGRNEQPGRAFGYLTVATPAATNASPWFAGQAAPPQFLNASGSPLPGGLYTGQSLELRLSGYPGAVVRFTFNGTDPTSTSGILYTNPLTLTQPNERTGIVVRARCFEPGLLPSEVITQSYLLRQPLGLSRNPVLMLSGDPGRSFYLPGGVLAIKGGSFVSANWWQASGLGSYNNAIGNGPPFERAVSCEFFPPAGYYPAGQPGFASEIGLRVSASPWQRPRMRLSATGQSPWPVGDSTQKPSFNLYFTGDYGSAPLQYTLFTNYPVREFRHLRLRAGKNDNLNPFITDELVRRLWTDLGHVGSRGLFCSLYVNAAYKGVYNLCERIREPFFQNHFRSTAEWDVNYIFNWVNGDNLAFQQLLGGLDRNLTNTANWAYVTNRIDLDNTADYFLLNIYCATWDWPANNFVIARERSTGPNSRFRFAVWDAEGACNAMGYGRPVSYNTIAQELIVPSGHPYYNQDLSRIFRRLATSPEFRLRFADRVNRHCFNGGVLDDRDPDGFGPRRSHFRLRLEALLREAGDLVAYNAGAPLSVAPFNTWTHPTIGRRTYLLGSTPGRRMLRDAGLWPATEPPAFNVYGGEVPEGFELQITNAVAVTGQTATVYYTLDGSDPRLAGGALNPAAFAFTNAFPIQHFAEVRARAKNDQTGEWSALTEALFVVGPVPASSDNLVVAELNYHPPDSSSAEIAARVMDPDNFEFIRLLNIGTNVLDLAGVQFTGGITFQFPSSPLRYLAPRGSILLVKNRAAFQQRYGYSCDRLIAGEYEGNLSNDGERLRFIDPSGQAIRDFIYRDAAPWPTAADGRGPTLLLRDPWSNPNHGSSVNWMASSIPGGAPGGVAATQTYSQWLSLFWPGATYDEFVSGPGADPDADGLSNVLEYAFALNPLTTSPPPRPTAWLQSIDGEPRLFVSLREHPAAIGSALVWERMTDSGAWEPEPEIELNHSDPLLDGAVRRQYVLHSNLSDSPARFLRVRVVQR